MSSICGLSGEDAHEVGEFVHADELLMRRPGGAWALFPSAEANVIVPQAWGVSRDGSHEVYATTGSGEARPFRPEWCVPTWKESQRPQSGAYGCGELLGRRTGDRVTTLNGRRTGATRRTARTGARPSIRSVTVVGCGKTRS